MSMSTCVKYHQVIVIHMQNTYVTHASSHCNKAAYYAWATFVSHFYLRSKVNGRQMFIIIIVISWKLGFLNIYLKSCQNWVETMDTMIKKPV